MQSKAARSGVTIVAMAVVIIGAVVLSNDDSSNDSTQAGVQSTTTTTTKKGGTTTTTTEPTVATIKVVDGQPVGGIQDLTFQKGQDIQFVVDSDTAAEVHFHGYDVMKDVEAGGKVAFDVPADIDGIFEVEVEETAIQIAQITVEP